MNSPHPVNGRSAGRIGNWLGPWLWVAALCLALGLGGDAAREFLRYERGALAQGELWRLITAHLVHLGWPHLWLNLAGLLILGNLFSDVLSGRDWWVGLLLSALAIDAGLWLIDTQVLWYVGLSGALHGLMVLGGLRLIPRQSLIGAGLVIGVVLKLGWEQWQGPLPFTESAAAGPVLVNAHLYGSAGGAVSFGLLWLAERLNPTTRPL